MTGPIHPDQSPEPERARPVDPRLAEAIERLERLDPADPYWREDRDAVVRLLQGVRRG